MEKFGVLKRAFAGQPWTVIAALMIAPVALAWTGFIELGKLGAHSFLVRDFINYWMGARLYLGHHTAVVFTPPLYEQAAQAAFAHRLPPFVSFSYPPSLLPLIAWVGLVPYSLALALWTALGLAALFAAAWPYSRSPWVAAAILVSPAVLACFEAGQNGLFTSALVVAALTRIDRRPVLAGALIGLLTVKPHLGLLLPVALLAARRWRVIWSAAASALAVFAASLALVGPEAWRLYLSKTAPFQGVMYHQVHRSWATMTPSPAVATVSAGGSWDLAWIVQGVATAAAVALVAVLFAGRARRPIGDLDRVVLVAATFLASPYSFNYDMSALAVLLLIAGSRPDLNRSSAWRCGSALLWAAPLVMVVVGVAGLAVDRPWPPIGSLMLAAGLGLVVFAGREGGARWKLAPQVAGRAAG
jgi:hypothetical protein